VRSIFFSISFFFKRKRKNLSFGILLGLNKVKHEKESSAVYTCSPLFTLKSAGRRTAVLAASHYTLYGVLVGLPLGDARESGISGTGTHNVPHIKNGDYDPAIRTVTEIMEENKRKPSPACSLCTD
jgi:hypothetical protein